VLIRPPPIWVQLWDSSVVQRIKVNRKDLGKLVNMQRAKGDSETLKETMGMLAICLIDFP
jgi:hypothetical protein